MKLLNVEQYNNGLDDCLIILYLIHDVTSTKRIKIIIKYYLENITPCYLMNITFYEHMFQSFTTSNVTKLKINNNRYKKIFIKSNFDNIFAVKACESVGINYL